MRADYEFSTNVKCVKPAKCQRIFCQRILSWLKMSDKQKNNEREQEEETKGGNWCTVVGATQIWRSTCHHYWGGGWGGVIYFELLFHSSCDLVPLAPTPGLNPLSIYPRGSYIWRPTTQLATIWSSKWEHLWRDIKHFSKFITALTLRDGPGFQGNATSWRI